MDVAENGDDDKTQDKYHQTEQHLSIVTSSSAVIESISSTISTGNSGTWLTRGE